MRYRLDRRPSVGSFTIGDVYRLGPVTGLKSDRLWFTGEDEIREVAGAPVASWKVPGQTAIPQGDYRLIITVSTRLKRRTPRLVDVPGFSGILIHTGNNAHDTQGCIVPGLMTNDVDSVWQSGKAYDLWYAEIETALLAGDLVWLEVRNPT